MAQVTEINDLDTLSQYHLLWNSLLPETPRASFFHTYEWLDTYWKHYGPGQRLRVLIISAAEKPIGILPLCERKRSSHWGSSTVLTYPLDDWSAWYGPIGNNQTATIALAMRHIARTPRRWDEIDLPSVADSTTDRGRTFRAMQLEGLTPQRSSYPAMSYIDTSGSWRDYLASRGQGFRQELQDRLTEMTSLEGIEIVRHYPAPAAEGEGDPRWDLYEDCLRITETNWQVRGKQAGSLCHPLHAKFYRDVHAAACHLGMAEIALVRAQGEPVAFCYLHRYGHRVIAQRMAADVTFPVSGLDRALLAYLINESFHGEESYFGLGVGMPRVRQKLRTGEEVGTRLTYTPVTSWRPQLARAGMWLEHHWRHLRHLRRRRPANSNRLGSKTRAASTVPPL